MDALKEMNVRISDGTANQALIDLGLNADEIREKFMAGGTSAREAMQKIHQAILRVEDPTKRYTILQKLLGTQFEDLGYEGSMALFELEGAANTAKDTLKEMADIAYDDIGTKLDNIGRNIKTSMLPAFQGLLGVIEDNETAINGLVNGSISILTVGLGLVLSNLDNIALLLAGFTTGKIIDKFGEGFLDLSSNIKLGVSKMWNFESASTVMSKSITKHGKVLGSFAGSFKVAGGAIAGTARTMKDFVNNLSWAGKITLFIAAVELLVAAYHKLNEEQIEAKEKVKELEAETEQYKQTYTDFYRELDKGAFSLGDNAARVDELITRLYALNGQTVKSDEDLVEMKTIVSELNTLYPKLGLVINEFTGELNMQEEQCRKTADELTRMAEQEYYLSAYQDKINKKKEAQAEYNQKLKETNEYLEDIGFATREEFEEYSRLQEKLNTGAGLTKEEAARYKELVENTKNFNREVVNGMIAQTDDYKAVADEADKVAKEHLDTMTAEGVVAQNNTETTKKQTEAIEAQLQAQTDAAEAAELASEYTAKWTKELERNTGAIVEASDNATSITSSLKDIGDITATTADGYTKLSGSIHTALGEIAFESGVCASTVEAKSQVYNQVRDNITKAYDDMKQSAVESLDGQIGLWDKWEQNTKVTGKELKKNLDSQLKGIENWNKNLIDIAKRTSPEFASYLQELGPSAAGEIAALAKMSDKELTAYVSKWNEKQTLLGKSVEISMGTVKENVKKGLADVYELFDQSDLDTHSYAMIQKAADKIRENPEIIDALDEITIDAVLKFGEHKEDFEKAGGDITKASAKGMENEKDEIIKATDTIAGLGASEFKKKFDTKVGGEVIALTGNDMMDNQEKAVGIAGKIAKKSSDKFKEGYDATVGEKSMEDTADSIKDGEDKVKEAAKEAAKATDDSYKKNYEANTAGQTWAREIANGIGGADYKIQNAAKTAGEKADTGFKSEANPTSTGRWYAQGIADGIRNNSSLATNAARTLAANVKSSVNAQLGIHSPSRVGMEQGMWYDKGIALGITSNTDLVSKAAKVLSNTMVNGVDTSALSTKLQALSTNANITSNHNMMMNIDYDRLGQCVSKHMVSAMQNGQFTIDKNATVKYVEKATRGVYR